MESSGSVFTRQNPFPPVSTTKRAHYHPSPKQDLSRKEKTISLSPVRLHQRSDHPPRPLNQESQQLWENLDLSASEEKHVFTEIWPASECGSSPDSNADLPEMWPDKLPTKLETSTVPSGTKENSVLAKYIERFRHGRPQSRDERQQMASSDGEEQTPFWWMTNPSVSNSTPTKSPENDGHDCIVYSSAWQPRHDRSFSVASDCSRREFDDTEIIRLQDRASRLLLRGECSPGDESIPVSSDGLGCSDLSSPVSVDEPLRTPFISSLTKPTPANARLGSAAATDAASTQKSTIPIMTPPKRPEDDILFQWRLRRKMEQARGFSQSMKPPELLGSAVSWEAPSLLPASASGQPYKSSQHAHPHVFPHMTTPQTEIPEAQRQDARTPNPPHALTAVLPPPPPSSLMSQNQALSHVPAHMHLLCNVLPCPNQSALANPEQNVLPTLPEPQAKVVDKEIQVSESQLRTSSDEHLKECLPSSRHASSRNRKEEGPGQQKGFHRNKKKKLVPKVSDQKMPPPSKQHSMPERASSNVSRRQNTTSLREQHQREESEEVHKERGVEGHATPSSPVHAALGEVVSEVLFPTEARTNPAPWVSSPEILSSPSQSPLPLNIAHNSLEVISMLLQEAEDSDGKEFEDDPLLQVLRHQRKWVKDQIRDVDVMLNEILEEQPVA